MEDFWQRVALAKEIVIFGYAEMGITLHDEIADRYHEKQVYFCDNNVEKQGEQEDGFFVFAPADIVATHKNALYIPASFYYNDDICHQLCQMGVDGDLVVEKLPPVLAEIQKNQRQRFHLTQMKQFHFDVDIARHCNLNCAGCAHFSPLAKEEFYDLDVYRRDVERLSKLFDAKASRIQRTT